MRKNPTMSKATPNDEVVEGVQRLPLPIGVNVKALEDAERMPEVNMTPNDGDNPTIADAAFATGKDNRIRTGGPSGSDPTPSKPGA